MSVKEIVEFAKASNAVGLSEAFSKVILEKAEELVVVKKEAILEQFNVAKEPVTTEE
jgi:hypothetical protein